MRYHSAPSVSRVHARFRRIRSGLASLLFAAGLMLVSQSATAETPAEWAKQNLDELVTLYRHFHSHPELSFHEQETARRFAEELKQVGFDVTTQVGGTGVVALLKNGPGQTLMLRTDLDALPVAEQTGLAYASQVTVKNDSGVEVGVMHACGHDVHITNLIAVGRFMASHRDQWKGTLMLIGQPAEERGAGAKAMLEDGLFEKFPKPDFAIALHVSSDMAAGNVGVRAGYSLANVDSVDITVHGKGGHGGARHNG
ncbi:MAG: amidohydrolase [Pirellulaceae bacterium]